MTIQDLMASFKNAYGKALEELGMFNLVVFGKTGVGKSTLINAVFGKQVAETGTGRPVTLKTAYYEHPDGYLGIYDSEGIEMGQEGDQIIEKFREIIRAKRSLPLQEQIHVIWYCVRAADLRFEDAQADFVRALAEEGVPVIFVLTQVGIKDTGEVHPKVHDFSKSILERKLPVAPDSRVFFTMAETDEFYGSPAHGLVELLDATFRIAPKGVEQALTAAQMIDMRRKKNLARKTIAGSATAAATTAATPIPFSDAFLLVPVQMALMARIAAIYGLGLTTGTLASVAGAAFAAGGVTQAAKYVVTNLLKFVPGANIGAGVIRASVATAFTYALGEAWLAVCERLLKMGPAAAAEMSSDEIQGMFMEEFRKQTKKPSPEELPDNEPPDNEK